MRGIWVVRATRTDYKAATSKRGKAYSAPVEVTAMKEKLNERDAEMWRQRFNKQGYHTVAVMRDRGQSYR